MQLTLTTRSFACIVIAVLAVPRAALPCILDVGVNASGNMAFLFPNWTKTEVVDFDTVWCDAAGCPGFNDATIQGLTIMNYGTAVGGTDIKGVYTCFGCSRASAGACTPTQTLTYAGQWLVNGTDLRAAWTWSGPLLLNADPCNAGPGGCACIFVMRVFVDIGACPAHGATVRMGPGFNDWDGGGIIDQYYCSAPWGDLADPNEKRIVYTVKTVDKEQAAPGDTVTYTIFYGRPGTTNLADVTIFDTQPSYTHYLFGSGVPAPDGGWDPDPGPPLRLKWTIPPPHPVAGGPSGELVFKLTVDWGNGESFEPGSGDVAAPEQYRLNNYAHVAFGGITGCATTAIVTDPATTVVARFLFWKVGDNDILFSPTYGQPPDEIMYSIFLKNVSTQKTWWDVRVWDTVPPDLDTWCINCGFEDPCAGWTMTPTGCAAATPGVTVSGGKALLTWRLDMPPGMTLTLRWKGQVKSTTVGGSTAINQAAIMEIGRTGIAYGTGHSGVPRRFTHLAPIVLPTTYISYVAYAAGGDDNTCPGFFIDFFPLNKKTQFELRGIEYQGTGWSTDGGVSASIGCPIGDCLGGFPGNASCSLGSGGIPGGGIAGCKAERVPAKYEGWTGTCMTYPGNFIYKLTANSPVLWQLLTRVDDDNQDNHTYTPATTLSFAGLMHYAWRRYDPINPVYGYGDSLAIMSTGVDAYGTYVAGLRTTVHLFMWDYANLSWGYRRTFELDAESAAIDMGTLPSTEAPWQIMSSDTSLIINEGFNIYGTLGCCCSQCGDNYGAFMPTRETGAVVSKIGSGNFYGVVGGAVCCANLKMVVGNTGVADANYRIWRYMPVNTIAIPPIPPNLNGTGGTWVPVTVDTVPWGQGTPGNPQAYWGAFNKGGTAIFKVEVTSGGPIQVEHGVNMFHVWGGGAVMHAANGNQTGMDYWLHQVQADTYTCKGYPNPTQVINIFCPKTGMAVRATTQTGYSATYTSNAPDQCVAFMALSPAGSQNYRIQILPGGAQGNVLAMYIQCKNTEKGYTAPFLQTGTHYVIITPPVVYAGASFWITVVVLDTSGDTKTDYCGTTSFTSTDPSAQLQGVGMSSYDYTWDSNDSGATCKGGGCTGICDNGVKLFVNVVFNRLGMQSIVAIDTADGSITGVSAVQVVGADVKLLKEPRLTVAASGDTVRFKVCWSNFSSASAFTFVVTDAVPVGMSFLPEASAAALNCGNTDGTAVTVAYTTSAAATMPPAASFTAGNPVAGTRWLRWTVLTAGVQTTGCACYRVTVN